MFKNHLKRMLFFMVVIGLGGWLYAKSLPEIYEASVDIRAGSPPIALDPNLPPEIARANAAQLQSDLDTDVGVLKSQKIFRDGLVLASQNLRQPELATANNLASLYPMYEVIVPSALNQYSASVQRVIQVRVRASSAAQAAEIANGVGYAFTDYRRQTGRSSVEDVASDLRKKLQTASATSRRLADEYQRAKQSKNVPDVGARGEALTGSLEGLRNKRDEAQAQLLAARSQVAEFRARLAGTPKTFAGGNVSVADPTLDISKSEVSRARDEYETLRTQFQDDATQVVDAKRKLDRAVARQSEIERTQKTVFSSQSQQPNPAYLEIQSSLVRAQAEIAGLVASIRSYDDTIVNKTAEARAAPELEVATQRILRDREISDRLVAQLQGSLSNYEADAKTRAVPMLAPADPLTITQPIAPEVRRWTILSLFAGALLGLAYSFAVESLRLPVHTSWQLAELTALPVAAAVPAIPKPLARRHEAAIREGSFKPIESFRYMAFSLLARATKPKTVMFAGVGGDVGASSAAAEFAVATARTGAKTILVDCDLRSPQLSTLFGVSGRTGVSDVLGRTVLGGDSADLLVPTEHEGLMLLPAGTSIEAGLADFQTSHIVGLLADLAARADLVVLDLPAVDIYSDAARLASFVDEACLVVSAKTTSYRAIPMAQEIMEKAGARSMSIVLTNASSHDEPFGTRVSDSLVRA